MGSDHSTSRRNAATAKDVQEALAEQSRRNEQRLLELIRENQRQLSATASVPHKQPAVTASFERQRSPYSYAHNDLQRQVNPTSPNNNLYPNLANTCNSAASTSSSSAYDPFANHNANPEEFVYVRNFVQGPQATHSPQRFQPTPTAPPIETLRTTNARSRSHSRQRAAQDEDIKCKTCGNNYGEKIFQCKQGHSSCASCKTRQVPCGQCFLTITVARNYDLEKYISERKVPCPYAGDGCRLIIKIGDTETHAKECPFKVLECPSLERCTWRGKLPHLLEHFETMHPRHRQGDLDKEVFLASITDASHMMHFIQLGSFNFLFHVKVTQSRVCMAAQLIGTKHSAAKWIYEVHIYNKSQPRRKIQYIDRCTSSSEAITDVFNRATCVAIPRDYAQTYICGGGMAYKFYIKKDEPENKAKEIGNNKKWHGPRRNANKNNNN